MPCACTCGSQPGYAAYSICAGVRHPRCCFAHEEFFMLWGSVEFCVLLSMRRCCMAFLLLFFLDGQLCTSYHACSTSACVAGEKGLRTWIKPRVQGVPAHAHAMKCQSTAGWVCPPALSATAGTAMHHRPASVQVHSLTAGSGPLRCAL